MEQKQGVLNTTVSTIQGVNKDWLYANVLLLSFKVAVSVVQPFFTVIRFEKKYDTSIIQTECKIYIAPKIQSTSYTYDAKVTEFALERYVCLPQSILLLR